MGLLPNKWLQIYLYGLMKSLTFSDLGQRCKVHLFLNNFTVCPGPFTLYDKLFLKLQKQPSRDVLSKRCSENMQQIYSRRPMPKCDFTWFQITLRHGCPPVNLLHISGTHFTKNNSERLLLKLVEIYLFRFKYWLSYLSAI